MKVHAFRLSPGDDLKKALEQFVTDNKIEAAIILTCVGSLNKVQLRMAGASRATELNEKFEIVSLVGTLSVSGCHLHISLADQSGVMTGGHLLHGCFIYTTAEVVLGEFADLSFSRVVDPVTGYKELRIQNKT